MRSFCALTLLLVVVLGCGGEPADCPQDSPDAAMPPDASYSTGAIGRYCASSEDCSGVPEIYCPAAGVCTRQCSYHSDCGCLADTTNEDLTWGRCDAACVLTMAGAFCFRSCQRTSDCANAFVCQPPAGGGFLYCGPPP